MYTRTCIDTHLLQKSSAGIDTKIGALQYRAGVISSRRDAAAHILDLVDDSLRMGHEVMMQATLMVQYLFVLEEELRQTRNRAINELVKILGDLYGRNEAEGAKPYGLASGGRL